MEFTFQMIQLWKNWTLCPYPKQEDNDVEEAYNQKDHKMDKTQYKQKIYKKKKNLYSKEDSSSSDMSEDEET
jgi:hypothetical protein